jgi:hypothetical protein
MMLGRGERPPPWFKETANVDAACSNNRIENRIVVDV